MSINTAESFLFKLCNDGAMKAEFAASPSTVLDRFPFSSQEREAFFSWDVRSLADWGTSPMLLMFGFTAMHGVDEGRVEYIRRMKLPAGIVRLSAA